MDRKEASSTTPNKACLSGPDQEILGLQQNAYKEAQQENCQDNTTDIGTPLSPHGNSKVDR